MKKNCLRGLDLTESNLIRQESSCLLKAAPIQLESETAGAPGRQMYCLCRHFHRVLAQRGFPPFLTHYWKVWMTCFHPVEKVRQVPTEAVQPHFRNSCAHGRSPLGALPGSARPAYSIQDPVTGNVHSSLPRWRSPTPCPSRPWP